MLSITQAPTIVATTKPKAKIPPILRWQSDHTQVELRFRRYISFGGGNVCLKRRSEPGGRLGEQSTTLITGAGTWNPLTRDYSQRLIVVTKLSSQGWTA